MVLRKLVMEAEALWEVLREAARNTHGVSPCGGGDRRPQRRSQRRSQWRHWKRRCRVKHWERSWAGDTAKEVSANGRDFEQG